ncbi:SDR family oxidoreductase [Streptomyces sp. NPDC029004]|uniref:SDR family oxidoreductase n=1 Tax=Streptomyces sp. NPDC029004 TaxID=3154490 RepID=UPI0034114276
MTDEATAPVALITGGSSGIGAATARKLLAEGHRVAVTGRSGERLQRFAEETDAKPGTLLTLPGDAGDHASVEAAVQATLDAYGRLDTVVANAGYATHDSLADGDPAGWRDMVLTNVLGPALLIHYALPALKETRGRVVLIGSVAGVVYTPGNIYGATKWAVTGLAENTRRMVTADGVGVTLVAPGRVETGFWDAAGGAPQGGINLTADQIADSVVWAVRQPAGVDINSVVIRPVGQPV